MVRIFNTYGPNVHSKDGRVISNFIMQALNNENITLFGDGLQTRNLLYCNALIEAMRPYMALPREAVDVFCEKHKLGASVINTDNLGEYRIKQLAEETLRQIPCSKSKLFIAPIPSDDSKRHSPGVTLAKEILAWEPKISLKEGLSKTIEYVILWSKN